MQNKTPAFPSKTTNYHQHEPSTELSKSKLKKDRPLTPMLIAQPGWSAPASAAFACCLYSQSYLPRAG